MRGAVVSAIDISERKATEDALRESGRAPIPAELEPAIAQIEVSARAQAALVDDLLDMSRSVTGHLRLHREEVEVAQVLDAAVSGPSAGPGHGASFTVVLPGIR